jgi:CDP-diacylglycerol--glycerol-3-phosphate 3-phosphatidyltransferase
MANLVTLSRLALVLAVMLLAYGPPTAWRLLAVPLLIVAFVTDAVDGYVARRRGEASVFGAMLDIAVDRAVEISLWVILADLDLVPVWVPVVFIVRGALVDTIRGAASAREQRAPFDTIRGRFAGWLVGGSFVRTLYAVVKAVAFCWLLLLHALFPIAPAVEAQWGGLLRLVGEVLVYLSVALCLIRGAPVVVEYLQAGRQVREPH